MDPFTKTYVSSGLVVLALFEFWAAMRIFGRKGPPGKSARTIIRLHRIGGYVFLIYFAWISWVCIDLMDRLGEAGRYPDSRAVIHGVLAQAVFLLLLLKISFVRIYQKYRPYAPLLGLSVTVTTLVIWGMAGWWFLVIM